MYSVLSKRTNIWHSTIFCSSGRLSANWLFYPISLVARQLPMSSTNKSWWVIWNAKRLPNMTQNSRKLTILLPFWAVPFVFTMGLKNNTNFKRWFLKHKPWKQPNHGLHIWECLYGSKFWSIYGSLTGLWKFMGWLEWNLQKRCVAPSPGKPTLPYLTTARVCSNLTSPHNAQLLRHPAWSNICSNWQMLSFADINIDPIWPQAIKTDEFSEFF